MSKHMRLTILLSCEMFSKSLERKFTRSAEKIELVVALDRVS